MYPIKSVSGAKLPSIALIAMFASLVSLIQQSFGQVAVTVTNNGVPANPISVPGDFIGLSYETGALNPNYNPTRQLAPDDGVTVQLLKNLAPSAIRFGGQSVDNLGSGYVGGSRGQDSSQTTLYQSDIDAGYNLASNAGGWNVIWSMDLLTEANNVTSEVAELNYIGNT